MIAQKLKWSSYLLYQRVSDRRNGKQLRQILGLKLNEIPSYSTLRNHWGAPYVLNLAERCSLKANQIIQGQKEHFRVAVDGTKVELPLQVHKPFGKHGRTSKNTKFFGVKLHLAVSLKGSPMASKVTPGNIHDSQVFSSLLNKLRRYKPIKGIWADGAYDDENAFHAVDGRDMGYLNLSKRNPRRNAKSINGEARKRAFRNTCFSTAASKRQIVEQVFDIFKEEHYLIVPWWCQTKTQLYNWIGWNAHVITFDMLFNHLLNRSMLDRARVRV